MNPTEAEEIVKSYGGAIALGSYGGVMRKKSTLPCSKAEIKQAYYVYIDAIIKDRKGLPEYYRNLLVETYTRLNDFVDDATVKDSAMIMKLASSGKLKKGYPDYENITKRFAKYGSDLYDDDLHEEIYDYINACYKKYGITYKPTEEILEESTTKYIDDNYNKSNKPLKIKDNSTILSIIIFLLSILWLISIIF